MVRSVSIIALALACAAHLSTASAQAPARFPGQAQALPGQTPYSTTKVPGTESVYIFHYGNYQSMFIIASDGVIVTDPQNPEAAGLYLAEIRKITDAPIRYVIYSHDHPDHISGGKPFKDAGASFVAHRNTKDALMKLNNPNIVPVDIAVDLEHALTVGGTHVELLYVGKNVSDSSLVVRLPNERLIYVVDFIQVHSLPYGPMNDTFPVEWQTSLMRVLALDWDRFVPGHPGVGRLGTKEDARDFMEYLQGLSAAVKKEADAGKCPEPAKTELRLPRYSSWTNYDEYLPGNVGRYCTFFTKGT